MWGGCAELPSAPDGLHRGVRPSQDAGLSLQAAPNTVHPPQIGEAPEYHLRVRENSVAGPSHTHVFLPRVIKGKPLAGHSPLGAIPYSPWPSASTHPTSRPRPHCSRRPLAPQRSLLDGYPSPPAVAIVTLIKDHMYVGRRDPIFVTFEPLL